MRGFQELNDIQKAFVRKNMRMSYSRQDVIVECAQDFGRLLASGTKSGLSMPVAFEAAREHFRVYGAAMVEFANLITIELMPPEKK